MGIAVLILGRSGSGKSSSLRNFDEGQIGVINVIGKPLPFRTKQHAICTTDYRKVMQALGAAKAKSIVIDDAGYLITEQFMRGHSESKGGNSVFSLYNDIADYFYNLMRFIQESLPSDKIVYIVMHAEQQDDGFMMPQTVGKLLNEKVNIPGMVSICLYSGVVDGAHVFHTRNYPNTPAKTPSDMDMLPDVMDNDLAAVDKAIRAYWGMAPLDAKPHAKASIAPEGGEA